MGEELEEGEESEEGEEEEGVEEKKAEPSVRDLALASEKETGAGELAPLGDRAVSPSSSSSRLGTVVFLTIGIETSDCLCIL